MMTYERILVSGDEIKLLEQFIDEVPGHRLSVEVNEADGSSTHVTGTEASMRNLGEYLQRSGELPNPTAPERIDAG